MTFGRVLSWIAFTGLLCLGLIKPAEPAPAAYAWRVLVGSSDVTRAADPVPAAGVLLVDAAGVAPSLGLKVEVADGRARIGAPSGVVWTGVSGSRELDGMGVPLVLERPLRIEGISVFLPVTALAELAGVRAVIDSRASTVTFIRGTVSAAPAGWSAFSVTKPASPSKREAMAAADYPPLLPPGHDNLRLALTWNRIAGDGDAAEFSAFGGWKGLNARALALVSHGPLGTSIDSGSVGLGEDGGASWSLEVGDVYDEIAGSAHGIRWLAAERSFAGLRGRPAFSLLAPEGSLPAVAGVGGELAVGRFTTVGAELSSEGAWLARGRYRRPGFGLFGYRRQYTVPATGLSGYLEARGLSLQGTWSRGGEPGRVVDWRDLALRIPLRLGVASLEAAQARTASGLVRSGAISIDATAGSLRVHTFFRRQLSESLLGGRRSTSDQRDFRAAFSWSAARLLRLDLLTAGRKPNQGAAEIWHELGLSLRIAHTLFQVLVSSSGSPYRDPFHLRIGQEFAGGFSLFLEYGRIASSKGESGSAESPARLKLSVHKTWDVATPPGGGTVEGRVAPVAAGLPVELGPWRTATDARGQFVFRNVPPGEYRVGVPVRAVPASLSPAPPQSLAVVPRRTSRAELSLVPFGEVRGRVIAERGEGVARVVLRLGDRVTASGDDGWFSFENVPPGAHRLHVDREHLPSGFALGVPVQIDLGLPPGGRLEMVELRLVRVRRSIVFPESRR